MDETDKKIGFLQKLSHSDTGRRAVLILGVVGIGLIFLSSILSSGSKGTSSTAQAASSTVSAAAADDTYAKKLEQELTSIIGHIQGAGTPHVLVTLEEGSAEIYAQEEKRATQQQGSSGQNTDSQETGYIIVKDADGSEHALTVTRRQPKVQGVVVACPGAAQPAVQQAVLEAVSAAAGVSSARVCIVPSA
ncbi:MAG: stage III sporulation protein AG [Oscillospiraceae bacterium]|nr:stage III sporulation protein AG [Oscillospiraceae bacterium]MDD3261485.1 stage III sporulation protein AG [Oscillospiraceae bacterium]